jgi:hypothetical protein
MCRIFRAATTKIDNANKITMSNLSKETIERINQQASYYSGYDENEDHTPISKGKYYGYNAGAQHEAGRAQGLVDALDIASGKVLPQLIAQQTLAKYKEVGNG